MQSSPSPMRKAAVVLLVLAAAVAGVVALAVSGKVPALTQPLGAIASSWVAAPADGGPLDAGPDAPVKPQAAPLTSAQLTAPLYHVTFLSECGAPAEMRVVLKMTVQLGRATEAQASTDPPDPGISACIERAALGLRWPASKRVDHVTVRY